MPPYKEATSVPSKPTDVTATAGNSQIAITWTSISGATSYNIYWSINSGDGKSGTKITGATSPYTITGLTNGATIYIWVTAVNSDGESELSSIASAMPTPGGTLSAPTGLTAIGGVLSTSVQWNAVTGASSYNLYWSTTSGVTTTTGTKISGITSTSYSHTGLTAGTNYYYIVTAVNAQGQESSASPQAMTIPQVQDVGTAGVLHHASVISYAVALSAANQINGVSSSMVITLYDGAGNTMSGATWTISPAGHVTVHAGSVSGTYVITAVSATSAGTITFSAGGGSVTLTGVVLP